MPDENEGVPRERSFAYDSAREEPRVSSTDRAGAHVQPSQEVEKAPNPFQSTTTVHHRGDRRAARRFHGRMHRARVLSWFWSFLGVHPSEKEKSKNVKF